MRRRAFQPLISLPHAVSLGKRLHLAFVRAATAGCHSLGGLHTACISHSSSGWEPITKALGNLVLGDALHPGSQTNIFLLGPCEAEGRRQPPGSLVKGVSGIHEARPLMSSSPPKGPPNKHHPFGG